MNRFLIPWAAMAVSLAVAAPASAQDYSATRVIGSIDEGTLTAVLDESGATWAISDNESDEGTPIYTVKLTNGMSAVMYLRACDPACTGLVMAAGFNRPDGVGNADLAERLRKFNDTHSAGKGFLGEGGSPMIQWYIITDGGITMANLKTQIDVFTDIGGEFSDALYN